MAFKKILALCLMLAPTLFAEEIVGRVVRVADGDTITVLAASGGTLSGFPDAIAVANHIDCMFFNGGLPYAFEVEHTTGVTSGLNRMLSFRNRAEHLNTRYVIVAPDEDRDLVMQRSQPDQFALIEPFFLPYSQVEDLYAFIQRHGGKLSGTNKEFLSTFMERCRAA